MKEHVTLDRREWRFRINVNNDRRYNLRFRYPIPFLVGLGFNVAVVGLSSVSTASVMSQNDFLFYR